MQQLDVDADTIAIAKQRLNTIIDSEHFIAIDKHVTAEFRVRWPPQPPIQPEFYLLPEAPRGGIVCRPPPPETFNSRRLLFRLNRRKTNTHCLQSIAKMSDLRPRKRPATHSCIALSMLANVADIAPASPRYSCTCRQ